MPTWFLLSTPSYTGTSSRHTVTRRSLLSPRSERLATGPWGGNTQVAHCRGRSRAPAWDGAEGALRCLGGMVRVGEMLGDTDWLDLLTGTPLTAYAAEDRRADEAAQTRSHPSIPTVTIYTRL